MATVLVVEDDLRSAEFMKALLDSLGHTVLEARDGEAGLARATEALPDLITVDVRMPKMDGFELTRRLKAEPRTADIPVLMITASSEVADLEKGVEAGVDDFISKPIRRLEYAARVKSLLKVRHLKGELDRTLAYLEDLEKL